MQVNVPVLFIFLGLMILFDRVHFKVMQLAYVQTANFAEWVAFIGSLLVFFGFIFSLYLGDLWGFATWLKVNVSEVFALPLFVVLSEVLMFAIAYLKFVVYRKLAGGKS